MEGGGGRSVRVRVRASGAPPARPRAAAAARPDGGRLKFVLDVASVDRAARPAPTPSTGGGAGPEGTDGQAYQMALAEGAVQASLAAVSLLLVRSKAAWDTWNSPYATPEEQQQAAQTIDEALPEVLDELEKLKADVADKDRLVREREAAAEAAAQEAHERAKREARAEADRRVVGV